MGFKLVASIGVISLVACTPKPTPTPTPVPTNCCYIAGPEDPAWEEVAPRPDPYNWYFIEQAEKLIPTACSMKADDRLSALAAKLTELNLCATKWNDAVLILRPDSLFEEWHAAAYTTNGCWTEPERAYIGAWTGPVPTIKRCK